MELRHLRYVVAIAEEQSFTRAAERCFIVQSSLSHQIKALERELGVALFARTSRRVELTAAGRAFLPAARVSIEAAERAAAEAVAATGEIRGTLILGVIPTATAVDVPAVLGEFRRAHPAVRVRLRGGGSDEFVAAIAGGGMDAALLGLSGATTPEGVEFRELASERLVAVVDARHRLAARRRIRLEDLAGEPFVDFPQGSPGRVQSDLAFEGAGLAREVAFEAASTDLILGIVREGLAVTLLSAAVVPEQAELRTVAVADGPTRVEYLAWSAFNPSPAATAFLQLLAGERDRRS
ncbi:LysR family transcriptional regulator [Gulosibacter sp. 10]|uniref:LysR family transcriptional regulator n=1 Tax=Gulosibacter sp. 10 TaxID=1255570 RepID=UPI00097EC8EF|nr:LysR family transcriptional regulator [Gulosibacter sp. 10]SJM68674.1 Transcriptional regulator, LysR family [Gulosibacter sp. 10]